MGDMEKHTPNYHRRLLRLKRSEAWQGKESHDAPRESNVKALKIRDLSEEGFSIDDLIGSAPDDDLDEVIERCMTPSERRDHIRDESAESLERRGAVLLYSKLLATYDFVESRAGIPPEEDMNPSEIKSRFIDWMVEQTPSMLGRRIRYQTDTIFSFCQAVVARNLTPQLKAGLIAQNYPDFIGREDSARMCSELLATIYVRKSYTDNVQQRVEKALAEESHSRLSKDRVISILRLKCLEVRIQEYPKRIRREAVLQLADEAACMFYTPEMGNSKMHLKHKLMRKIDHSFENKGLYSSREVGAVMREYLVMRAADQG